MSDATKPFSAAADRNKEAIGDALADYFTPSTKVFEIGSGTGQHAIYLCERFANLHWQCTEQSQHLATLGAALSESSGQFAIQGGDRESAQASAAPIELDVGAAPSGLSDHTDYTLIFSANTAHIMSIEEVAAMFAVAHRVMAPDGHFALYGPFKINGRHTSEGNRNFDQALKAEVPHRGIRDIAELSVLARRCDLGLHKDIPMPANNRILMWKRQ